MSHHYMEDTYPYPFHEKNENTRTEQDHVDALSSYQAPDISIKVKQAREDAKKEVVFVLADRLATACESEIAPSTIERLYVAAKAFVEEYEQR